LADALLNSAWRTGGPGRKLAAKSHPLQSDRAAGAQMDRLRRHLTKAVNYHGVKIFDRNALLDRLAVFVFGRH